MTITNVQVTLSESNIDAIKRINQNGVLDLRDDVEAAMVIELLVSDIAATHTPRVGNILPFKRRNKGI